MRKEKKKLINTVYLDASKLKTRLKKRLANFKNLMNIFLIIGNVEGGGGGEIFKFTMKQIKYYLVGRK